MKPAPDLADAEYILPLKWADDAGLAELADYLTRLSRWLPVTVIDGSDPDRFAAHARAFPPAVRHLPPDPLGVLNGKVAGVLTGLRQATAPCVVIADDDVRYTRAALEQVVAGLGRADVVRPQNHFIGTPAWHVRWDTARSLINRALGSDYPGTVAVRRAVLEGTGGYDGNVLFENLELLRTVRAAGGTELRADDLFVPRLPCSSRHFRGQRVRQAYDSFAQPARLMTELSLLPLILSGLRRPRRLAALAAAAVAVAETGRRRAGGTAVYPPTAALWAPAWTAERAVCIWAALYWRLRGGVPYAGRRLRRAGHSVRALRRRLADAAAAAAPTPTPDPQPKETDDRPQTAHARQLSRIPA
ncbi:hypothetical protein BN1051_02806 [Arthrobacter saudimassiliensis]|uniref:Glycosyltransferase 2-like domain-containing protein n=1 Tax=Arthrobacter saudimassiliensis TaxID=1461584 RepID=A0A078MX87_9MICC|nr:hypothetical protein BN1051_02806 [Arthrobacter saudimassiliensis]